MEALALYMFYLKDSGGFRAGDPFWRTYTATASLTKNPAKKNGPGFARFSSLSFGP